MPQTFYVSQPDAELCYVTKNGTEQQAHVLDRRQGEVYVHYLNTDKRLDEWVPEDRIRIVEDRTQQSSETVTGTANGPSDTTSSTNATTNGTKKRKRSKSIDVAHDSGRRVGNTPQLVPSEIGGFSAAIEDDPKTLKMTEEEYDLEHHKRITARRNFEKVIFGRWCIRTWYYSPYPFMDNELESEPSSTPGPSSSAAMQTTSAHARSHLLASSGAHAARPPPSSIGSRLSRSSGRAHARTSDLMAGGLARERGHGHGSDGKEAESVLWVCEKCFKYMTEGGVWEAHNRRCTQRHPPGRKVYQRGAHIIWEVDGAKEKLYCQNLSLFGKLFIDIKTLFFDCDNFLFYILTDADSTRDHVLGFFSKEKISYDDYNLACIVVLPPYQRKGYGMLMIEFSYELSRRAGKIGTPERPLSDLGLRSYLTYWIATIVRYLRRLLSVLPSDVKHLISPQQSHDDGGSDEVPHVDQEAVDSVLSLLSPSLDGDASPNGNGSGPGRKKKKSTKGWDGETVVVTGDRNVVVDEHDDPLMPSRILQTTANADGSATTHVIVQCSLQDLSRATGLRVEDVAFALTECGLLRRRIVKRVQPSSGNNDVEGERQEEEYIIVSREMVEAVAEERNVKKMCMELKHVLL